MEKDTVFVNLQMKEEEEELKEKYMELGKAYYEGGFEDPLPELLTLFDEITKIKNKNQLQMEEMVPEADHCPHCGASLKPDSRFCSSCGGKIETEPQVNICPNCGAAGKPDAIFCNSCGTRVK